jgi:hypothetical protein
MNAQQTSLDVIVETLDGIITQLAASGLYETIALLKIARLDLIMRAYGLSDGDLEALLSVVNGQQRILDVGMLPDTKIHRKKQVDATGNC